MWKQIKWFIIKWLLIFTGNRRWYDLSVEMNNQCNRATSWPVYVVYNQPTYVVESDGEKTVFINTDSEVEIDSEDTEAIKQAMLDWNEDNFDEDTKSPDKIDIDSIDFDAWLDVVDIMSDIGFEVYHLDSYYAYKELFFTENQANLFVQQQKHNLNNPIVYVESACRNYHLRIIMRLLSSLSDNRNASYYR